MVLRPPGVNILNFGTEMMMSDKHLDYLKREHARLGNEIELAARGPRPDEVAIARLKKLKLAIKDQIAAWCRDLGENQVA